MHEWKNATKNSKSSWEIRLETQIRKFRQHTKILSQNKNARICWDEKKKTTQQLKTNDTTRWNKSEGTGKRRKTKKISRQDQTIHTNGTFKRTKKKFYLQTGGKSKNTYPQPNVREAKQFWSKMWKGRDHNWKAEWRTNMEKELQALEKGSKAKILLDSLRATLKKVPNWKKPGHEGIHGF